MLKYILVIITFWLFFYETVWSWSYPIKELSKPTAKCKFDLWSNLWSDCKITLPKLTPSEYKTKLNDLYYRRIYTVLWTATYKYWWDKMQWTHLWVDIATSKWTPVYAIWDGKVVFVWTKTWWWKVVVIQHKVNWKYIYSNYAHLSKITVSNWINIKEWTKIWEVWSTWNSTWNHLHFQIDKNQSIWNHPFWFKNCWKGQDIFSIVNWNSCLSSVIKNTIDPLEFLANNGANIDFEVHDIPEEQKKEERIQREWMKTREEIRREMIKDFLRSHKFDFSFEKSWVYELWEYGHFTISLKDWRWRPYRDILPWDLKIVYDTNYFSAVSPRSLKVLDGSRKVSFKTKKTWVTFFTIKLWEDVISQQTIRIVKKWSYITPAHGEIITLPGKKYVWESSWWINLFQDKGYIKIIKVPFAWTYNISADNMKLCKAPTNLNTLNKFECNAYNMYDDFNFSYKDTIAWLLVFKYVWQTKWTWKIYVKDLKGNIITESRNIYFNDIKLVNNNTQYKSVVENACKNWLCLWLSHNGYIWNERDINQAELKYMLRNFLLYFWKKTSTNISYTDKNKKITRIDFIEEVFKTLWIKVKDYPSNNTNYIDVKNLPNEIEDSITYLNKLWFSWKDKFKRYFQPNKNITTQEALHLLNFLLEKYKK